MRRSVVQSIRGGLNSKELTGHKEISFLTLLTACAKKKDLHKGTILHTKIVERGLLETSPYLANALINMYAKCGMLGKAQEMLEELPVRDKVSWSALISGYAQHGQGHEALNCFDQMRNEGLCPDAITFTCILKACGSLGAIDKGKQVHKEILSRGLLKRNIVLGNALVDMYAKCGFLAKAQDILKELPVRDVISWNALITGYAQLEQGHDAMNCFEQMKNDGISPNAVTFIGVLKACGCIGAINEGKQIHIEIVTKGLLNEDVVLGTALMDMYAKCGLVAKAQEVLEELPVRNVISWSTLIVGYTHKGQGHEALECFERMQREGLSPDPVAYVCILQACGNARDIDKGKQIHEDIVINGLFERVAVLGNAIVDMYAKCGVLAKAQEVLERLPVRSIVSWSALIAGYAEQGQCQQALNCFEQMQSEGISPNAVTLICILKACGNIGATMNGEQIHEEIMSRNLLMKDIELGNALIDMYAKCGELTKAQKVLEGLPNPDIISWNTLIAGYAQQGLGHEALNCFERMQSEGLFPDSITFICIVNACGTTGAIEKGGEIHEKILNRRLLEKDIVLGNALVDMYAKCGMLAKAQDVLQELPVRDIISWSTLIAGYAQEGRGEEALRCFERMRSDGLSPNAVTFLCVLSACAHSGLLDEAQMLFGEMTETYGISPSLEHHICMVAVFGRTGHFDKAISVIKVMPSYENPAVWLALLGACRKWGNVRLGRLAFDQAVQIESCCSAAYMLMVNIFAAAGMQEDAKKIEAMRQKYASGHHQQCQGNVVSPYANDQFHDFLLGDTYF